MTARNMNREMRDREKQIKDVYVLVSKLLRRMDTLEISRYKLADMVGERMGIQQPAADRRLQRMMKDRSNDLDFNFVLLVCDLLGFKIVLEDQ